MPNFRDKRFSGSSWLEMALLPSLGRLGQHFLIPPIGGLREILLELLLGCVGIAVFLGSLHLAGYIPLPRTSVTWHAMFWGLGCRGACVAAPGVIRP